MKYLLEIFNKHEQIVASNYYETLDEAVEASKNYKYFIIWKFVMRKLPKHGEIKYDIN